MIRKILFFVVPAILLAANLWGQAPQKYAVLIGGDINATNIPAAYQWNNGQNMGPYGYDEFWNDTYLMWEMLYAGKGYSNENIHVLFNNGSDFNFQGQANRYKSSEHGIPQITDYSATKANVQAVFSSLANTLTDDDFLYVWIMSHGWNDTETQQGEHHSWVFLYGYDPANPAAGKLYDYELKTMLDAIPALKKVVFVQAPGSGGFADELEGNTTIVHTSSDQDESSLRADDEDPLGNSVTENEVINNVTYHHGEFGFHIYSPINGKDPAYNDSYAGEDYEDANTNEDHLTSLGEAIDWQDDHYSGNVSPVVSDIGNIDNYTSLQYTNLLFEHITTNKSYKGICAVTAPPPEA